MALEAHQPALGVVACGGTMPLAVAEAAIAQGRRVHVVALKGQADPGVVRFPHDWVRLGELGHLIGSLKRAGCQDIVIIGTLRRPNIWKSGIDFGFLRHLPTILSLSHGGDDSVLARVARFFEGQGFRVRGAHEIAPLLLAPGGALSGVHPDQEALRDIAQGFALLDAMAPFDVGQAVVVARSHVLAVEAAEGTDGMLRRCAELRQWGGKKRAGVLIKAPKQGQDMRMDIPVIGPRTVELAAAAGLAGIAVAAGQVMIAEQADVIELADRQGLFVIGAKAAGVVGRE
jgi:UDP-2,3-diacylglucosamine hydrolase